MNDQDLSLGGEQKRGRGRPKASEQRGHERKEGEAQRKEERRPMGVTLQLDVADHIINPDGGNEYKGRWFVSARVPKAKAAWWELVDGQTRPSGEDTLYLMRIKREYWDESQAIKNNRIHDVTKAQVNEGVDYIPGDRDSAATIEHF